jgi:prophage regulatory protein
LRNDKSCVNQTVSSALTPFAPAPGLSRSTIYRKIAEGTFPAQLKISTNGAGWRESDINRWIADPAGWRQRSRNEFDLLDDY